MTKRSFMRFTTLALAAAVLGGCADEAGFGDQARITVSMVQGSGGPVTSPVADGVSASVAQEDEPMITQDDVGSLRVTVTEIQFLRESANEDDESEWLSLPITPTEIDLMTLPGVGEQALTIADGSVDPGSYSMVRIFVQTDPAPQITFTRDITLGAAATFNAADESGEPSYDVFIPSGTETGLKTDFQADVGDGDEVLLVFDPAPTFLNVNVTGNGMVILAPVFRAPPTDE
jgi:hypothetical protein